MIFDKTLPNYSEPFQRDRQLAHLRILIPRVGSVLAKTGPDLYNFLYPIKMRNFCAHLFKLIRMNS